MSVAYVQAGQRNRGPSRHGVCGIDQARRGQVRAPHDRSGLIRYLLPLRVELGGMSRRIRVTRSGQAGRLRVGAPERHGASVAATSGRLGDLAKMRGRATSDAGRTGRSRMGATVRDLSGNVEQMSFPFIAGMLIAHDCRVSDLAHKVLCVIAQLGVRPCVATGGIPQEPHIRLARRGYGRLFASCR
jgi:hypothetical protein